MKSDRLIQKHVRLTNNDLQVLDTIKRSQSGVHSFSDVIHLLIENYFANTNLAKQLKEKDKELVRLKAQTKQLSRIENEVGVLLYVQSIGTRSLPEKELQDYREAFDKLVDKQIKNAQERVATKSVKKRKKREKSVWNDSILES